MNLVRTWLYSFVLCGPPFWCVVNNGRLFANAAPARSNWSKLDLASLEKEWETGDNEEDLRTPDDELYALTERNRQKALDKLETLITTSAPNGDDDGDNDIAGKKSKEEENALFERAALDAQHAGKAVMIFATLRELDTVPKKAKEKSNTEKNDGKWDWDSMSAVCDEWSVSIHDHNMLLAPNPLYHIISVRDIILISLSKIYLYTNLYTNPAST